MNVLIVEFANLNVLFNIVSDTIDIENKDKWLLLNKGLTMA